MIKRLDELEFDEAAHIYKVGNKALPSVTGFVKQFFAPFNGREIAAKMVEKRLKQGV